MLSTHPSQYAPEKATGSRIAAITLPVLGGCMLLVISLASALAESKLQPLSLAIQPVYDAKTTLQRYQPLADFLGEAIGRRVEIKTLPNFFAYWSTIRREQSYDFILDAAHFTDYRIQKHGYDVLAKIPGTINHSLVIHKQGPIKHPMDLIGQRVAALGTPSMGSMRLTALYPNPLRQPTIVDVDNLDEVIEQLLHQKVQAAILPVSFFELNAHLREQLKVIVSTEPLPQLALSAAPTVNPATRQQVRDALLKAKTNKHGVKLLQHLGISHFEATDPELYAEHSRILKKYWGY